MLLHSLCCPHFFVGRQSCPSVCALLNRLVSDRLRLFFVLLVEQQHDCCLRGCFRLAARSNSFALTSSLAMVARTVCSSTTWWSCCKADRMWSQRSCASLFLGTPSENTICGWLPCAGCHDAHGKCGVGHLRAPSQTAKTVQTYGWKALGCDLEESLFAPQCLSRHSHLSLLHTSQARTTKE